MMINKILEQSMPETELKRNTISGVLSSTGSNQGLPLPRVVTRFMGFKGDWPINEIR